MLNKYSVNGAILQKYMIFVDPTKELYKLLRKGMQVTRCAQG